MACNICCIWLFLSATFFLANHHLSVCYYLKINDMKNLKQYSLFVALIMMTISCEKEKNGGGGPSDMRGVFIVNEGAFGQSNGDVSFMSNNGFKEITLFSTANNRPLGDVVQSMCIIGDKAYLVANNSQKIEVVSMTSFKSVGVITGLSSPRFITQINNTTAYVSDWISNSVKIIDLNTNQVIGSINAGNGPEQMINLNSKVYVTNVGGFGKDSTVTVIDAGTNTVQTTIQVGINPNSVIVDNTGMVWVLCGGSLGDDFTPNTADDIGGKLVKINPVSNTIVQSYDFAQGKHPLKLTTNFSKTTLYYLHGSSAYTGDVRRMSVNASVLPSTAIVNREFYGLGIHPGNENIHGSIGSFSANSHALRYSINGTLIDSMQVGIGPNGFVFN